MTSSADEASRRRVLDLLKQHGWNATSFQTLESQFHYWFEGEDACIAYVDTGHAWVAAGAPIAASGRLADVAARFVEAAAKANRRASFFGVEERFTSGDWFTVLPMGEQPVWDPTGWSTGLSNSPSLREQLRRARAKGVEIRVLNPDEISARDNPVRSELEAIVARWSNGRTLPPMQFLVALEPFTFASEKRVWVAEVDHRPVAFLAAAPVYQREGWLFEDIIRDPGAPNGTVELLIDTAMRFAEEQKSRFVTLGLVPLSGPIGVVLRIARFLGQNLYDFEGLKRFKTKLQPSAWTPISLAVPKGQNRAVAVYDVLSAFAGGGLTRFVWNALGRDPAFFTRVLSVLLFPWTLAIALAGPTPWFPSNAVWAGWIAFDTVFAAALFVQSSAFRLRLGFLLAIGVSLDASITLWEAAAYNVPRLHGFFSAGVISAAVLAPTIAAIFLWRTVLQRARARL